MKKKLKKQIEKQQQQQDEIEQGMLEEDEEALEKDAEEECCSTENCVENSKECVEQNVSELETNASQEETVENHVDSSESVEFSEELSSQTLQEKCVVSNDDMSITEEQNESGKAIILQWKPLLEHPVNMTLCRYYGQFFFGLNKSSIYFYP